MNNREELLKRAKELNLFIPDCTSDKTIDSLVRFEESRIILLEKFNKSKKEPK